MLGCLGKFIKLTILILAIIGFIAIGGVTFLKDFVKNPFSQAQESKMEKAYSIADFSKLDKEFEIVSSAKLPKIGKYVYIKHAASNQHFFLSKPAKKDLLTKNDFYTRKAHHKIKEFFKDYGKVIGINKLNIYQIQNSYGLNQEIPYVKFQVTLTNIPIKDINGYIGVANKENEDIIIISANTNDKYSQIITNALLTQIK